MTARRTRRTSRGLLLAACAALVPWTAGACDTISAALFGTAPPSNPDVTPPTFSDPRPAPDVTVVSSEVFTIQVTDPGGASASGVNPARFQAQVIGFVPLPLTVLLPEVTVHLGSIPDGPIQVALVAEDFAGNSAAYVFTVTLDRAPPSLAFPAPPQPNATSSAPSQALGFTVQVGDDPNFLSAQVEVLSPGPDGTCGTADDTAVPISVVAAPVRTLPGPGIHPVAFVFTNPVPPLGEPRAELYCWIATAQDAAVTLEGEAGANTARLVASTLVTWSAPPLQ